LRIYQNYLALIDENAHDKLTGLLNRKTFDDRFISILQAARQLKDPVRSLERRQGNVSFISYWLAVIDIDHFKRINDTYGHLYGDEVLLLMANLMRSSFRRKDLLFRYGGEEFVIVLKTASFDETSTVLERFRKTMENYCFPQVGQVTVSIGFTEICDSEIPTMIIERADRALYYVKENGRNQIRNYEQLITLSALTISQKSNENEVEFF
jgi:diguanylate cyclase (GGDEF)-like protein